MTLGPDYAVTEWFPNGSRPDRRELIVEEPLSIRIEGRPYSVVMRTPGDESAHVAGFCLAEGLADTPEDISAIGVCDDGDTNVVTVTLRPGRRSRVTEQLERRGYISQTSCGICGKQVVADLYQRIRPLENGDPLACREALKLIETMSGHQPLRNRTRAAHAALIYAADFRLLSVAEDVGRHNALDKAVGKLFLEGRLDSAALLVLSSRISYELVQKAARARLPVILALSRPTSLAVDLAAELNITLATRAAKGAGLTIYTCPDRLAV
jgi:FdhD protein